MFHSLFFLLGLGDALKLVLLLVGRVDELVGQALGDRLDVPVDAVE